MNVLIKILLTAIFFTLLSATASAHHTYPTYGELKLKALYDCPYRHSSKIDVTIIDKLIAVEKQYNVHPSVRGMVLAAACMESGFNPNAKGDRKFSKDKKTPKAIGILQMWKWYEKHMGVDRRDVESSAHGWMKHIINRLPGVRKQCKFKDEKKLWVAAWVTGIRYKKKGGRCYERPLHLRILRKWQKQVRKDRRAQEETQGSCGC